MILTYTDGCTCTGFDIDGKKLEEFTMEEKKNIMNSLMDKYGNERNINDLIMNFVYDNGEPEYKFHCDQCGDSVYEYTMEI